MAKTNNLHEGHRDRLKNRFLREGLDNFEPHNVLELLLFFSVPKRDTNDTAHELLNTFGGISDVFDAPPELLQKVAGIGKHTMVLLKLIPELCRRYEMDRYRPPELFDTTKKWTDFFKPKFIGRQEEVLYIAGMDDQTRFVACEAIQTGTAGAVEVPCEALMQFCMQWHVNRIMLAHNHPRGAGVPSWEDCRRTKELYQALSQLDIFLEDHVVVGRNGDAMTVMTYQPFHQEDAYHHFASKARLVQYEKKVENTEDED